MVKAEQSTKFPALSASLSAHRSEGGKNLAGERRLSTPDAQATPDIEWGAGWHASESSIPNHLF